MVLDKSRGVLEWWLVPLAKLSRHVNPDHLTWAALLFAVLGGLSFYFSGPDHPWLLLAAFVCVGLNSILDLLDGKVAKLANKASPRGDYLDHAVDRMSDVALLAGVGLSPWCRPTWGLVAIAGTLLTSYMGTQAQAVGLKRIYGGLLGRADRMVLLLVLPIVQLVAELGDWTDYPAKVNALSYLEGAMVVFAVLGVLTTVQRFLGGLRGFGPDGKPR